MILRFLWMLGFVFRDKEPEEAARQICTLVLTFLDIGDRIVLLEKLQEELVNKELLREMTTDGRKH